MKTIQMCKYGNEKYERDKIYIQVGGTRLHKDCMKDKYKTKFSFSAGEYNKAKLYYDGINIGPGFKKRMVHILNNGICNQLHQMKGI